ncbi:sigma-70 family RNA polymerase sigma factor [Hymenobacter sp. GOD-10R]|uniref:RNA polymerase sigma factor n=1 Tax=Hymenobacter sp. GOD-10R TaxID=3093922 RepID=UPI002D78E562|nr:sigma-70 family RNA polymerase sigma factor [Hymenobacter sp. GOD-10R]WRQ29016.1 sigma-70 family RNA polymerase sigma factor [Hymenobacter sp. GOD-10R]
MAASNQQSIIGTVKRYGKQLFAFIRGRVESDEDAEDVLQEVWYQFTSQSELETIEQVSGWLHRVARNKIVDKFRKKHEDRLDDYSYEDEEGELSFREILLAEAPTPEEEDLKQFFWEQLFQALDELPEAQRYVFVQNELEDRTLQEIADEVGVGIKTIISRKGYAVAHLRKRLANLYHEFLNY